MKKSKGIILGVAFNAILCLPVLFWWALTMRDVRVTPSSFRDYVFAFLVLVVLTSVVMYGIWFNKAYKRRYNGDGKIHNWVPFWAAGITGAFVIAFTPALICQFGFNYNVAGVYAYLGTAFGIVTIGSLLPYIYMKKKL